jgi:PelA/Pel-15E family pectate lyase
MRRKLASCCSIIIFLAAFSATTRSSFAEAPRTWPPDPFLPVTKGRIAGLPAAEQTVWRAYLDRSAELLTHVPARKAKEFSPSQPLKGPSLVGAQSHGLNVTASKDWYATAEPQAIADRVVEAQSNVGGWNKGNDYTQPLPSKDAVKIDVWSAGTFDNNATILELRVLALTSVATTEAARTAPWREAFFKGLDYLLAAQYPNGGFPQIYPLVGGYHDAITFNDDAMVQILELLRDISLGKPEFAFVSIEQRERCSAAEERGVGCILAAQIKAPDGRLTAWCQQHDALTLQPCAARNFEPIATCSDESSSLVRFLMSLPRPSHEVVAAVRGAISWFEVSALHDVRWNEGGDQSSQLVAQPGAPLLWARLYEVGTDKPIFGDRDRTIHYSVDEISTERRNGYSWYGQWPAAALKEFKKWSAKHS